MTYIGEYICCVSAISGMIIAALDVFDAKVKHGIFNEMQIIADLDSIYSGMLFITKVDRTKRCQMTFHFLTPILSILEKIRERLPATTDIKSIYLIYMQSWRITSLYVDFSLLFLY